MRDGGTRSLPLRSVSAQKSQSHGSGPEPSEGLRLGRYELLISLARGGMAEVWVARLIGELGFSRIVAVKTIRSEYAEDPLFRASFFEEARIAARLRHTNAVEVLDLGEQGSTLYLVMTLVEGDSVASLLRIQQENQSGRSDVARHGDPTVELGIPAEISVRIMIDALAGLHAAHELTDDHGAPMELVHRDVSPQNILVGIDGVTKLSDFGVAKALGRHVDETEMGQIRGKPGYLAPEQLERKRLDRRSDVFAAGIVLWEMLAGRRLFRRSDTSEPLARVTSGPIPDPRIYAASLAPEIASVVMRALCRVPEERFQTAGAMGDALETGLRQSGTIATTKQVGSFVSSLCMLRVETNRFAVRQILRGETRSDRPRVSALRSRSGEPRSEKSDSGSVTRALDQPSGLPAPHGAAESGTFGVAREVNGRRRLGLGIGLGLALLLCTWLLADREDRPIIEVSDRSADRTTQVSEPSPAAVDPATTPATTRDAQYEAPASGSHTKRHPKPKFGNPYSR